ncbi:benzoate transporter, partial [Mycobacterium tuberculosis]|nr:benzoate transporter [Mycobacterium tuberculosis]
MSVTEPPATSERPVHAGTRGRSHLLQPAMAGLLAGIVGFAGAFPVVLAGYAAVGASPAEAASGLMVMTMV